MILVFFFNTSVISLPLTPDIFSTPFPSPCAHHPPPPHPLFVTSLFAEATASELADKARLEEENRALEASVQSLNRRLMASMHDNEALRSEVQQLQVQFAEALGTLEKAQDDLAAARRDDLTLPAENTILRAVW